MKNILFMFSVLLISFLGFSKISRASHYAAADLTYTCLGGNNYQITLTFFRDCSGVDADLTATVNFESGCGNYSIDLPIVGTGVEVTPTCPSQATTCTSGSLYGLEKYIYQGQVNIPACSDWSISWESCCRNPSNTLYNSTSQSWYMPAFLNNAVAPCNSSPYFTNMPATVICQGQYFCYNHGAIDPDGDSLVYSLTAPFQGAGIPVTYQGGYNALNPLPSNPPVSIDPLTGDICMNATTTIIAVLGVQVEEWRRINGVPTHIGTILRDMQVNVIACTNLLPDLAGINPLATAYNPNDTIYAIEVCLGETIDFDIFPYDANLPAQNLTLTSNLGIPGCYWIITDNGTPNPVGHVIWYPSPADAGNIPHCFTVNVKDNNCPYIGQQTKSYCITVKNNFITLDPPGDTMLCLGDSYQLRAHSGSPVVNYNWYVDSIYAPSINDTTFLVNSNTIGPGTHVISCFDGGINNCPGSNKLTVTVNPTPTLSATASPSGICPGMTSDITASGAETYSWDPGSLTSDSIHVAPFTTTIYTVTGTDTLGCKGSDTALITVFQVTHVSATANPPVLCEGQSTQLSANGATNFTWQPGGIPGNDITETPSVSTIYTVTGESNGCLGSDTVTVMVYPFPLIQIAADIYKGCEDLAVNFSDLSISQDVTWYWNFGDHGFSYQQNPYHLYIDPGDYDVSLTLASPIGCAVTFTWFDMIEVYSIPYAFFTPHPEKVDELDPTVFFCNQSLRANEWNWYFGDTNQMINVSNLQNPVHTFADTGAYTVTMVAFSENGCTDTFRYVINVMPNISFYVPNAFSPNGDGKNETFRGKGMGIDQNKFEMYIFNRWGEEIYRSTNPDDEWDGRDAKKGNQCVQGTYIWVIKFTDLLGDYHSLKGNVMLMK